MHDPGLDPGSNHAVPDKKKILKKRKKLFIETNDNTQLQTTDCTDIKFPQYKNIVLKKMKNVKKSLFLNTYQGIKTKETECIQPIFQWIKKQNINVYVCM